MATQTVASVVATLDRYYFPNKLVSLALQDAPLTAYFPKDPSAGGEHNVVRMHVSNGGGIGVSVADAAASQIADNYKRAIFDWKLLYVQNSFSIPAIKRAENNKGIVDILQMAVKSHMGKMGNTIEGILFGGGNGRLGQVAAINGNVITLTNFDDSWNFEPGMVVLFDDTATGASPRVGEDAVVSVNHSEGLITFENLGDVTGEAVNDFMFLKGLQNGGTVPGLEAFIPDAAPVGGDNFGGLDRSTNPDELAGWRFAVTSGLSVTEGLIRGLRHGRKFGGKQDTIFMHEDLMVKLILEQADRVVYQNVTNEEFKVNFRGVQLQSGSGTVTCIGSPRCKPLRAYALEQDSWSLQSVAEPLIAVATKNGKYQDLEGDDAVLARWRSQFGLSCALPGHNGVVKFASI